MFTSPYSFVTFLTGNFLMYYVCVMGTVYRKRHRTVMILTFIAFKFEVLTGVAKNSSFLRYDTMSGGWFPVFQ
jgi:hypothetical protein